MNSVMSMQANPKQISERTSFKETTMYFTSRMTVIIGLTALCVSGALGQSKRSPDLTLTGNKDVNVIVQFQPRNRANAHAAADSQGGTLLQDFAAVNSALYRMPARALDALSRNPNITYISPDRKVNGTLEYANPAVGATLAASYGYKGNGVGVAIIDSGLYSSHLDFFYGADSRVVYSQNFVAGESTTSDAYGHGTHVGGIVAGNGTLSLGSIFTLKGIAPRSNLINLRVLNGAGQGTDSQVIAAISRAIELKTQFNIRVINLSLGRPIRERAIAWIRSVRQRKAPGAPGL